MKRILYLLLFLFSISAFCSDIEFVVSASPGGPADTVSRKVLEVLKDTSLDNIVVLNKPGAAHTIAYNYILNSKKPTLIISTSEIQSNPVVDTVSEIYNLGHYSNLLVVSSSSGIKNISDFYKVAETREILFGTSGIGTANYLAMKKFCYNIRCLEVPYKSANEGLLGIMSGQIDAYAVVSYGIKPYLDNNGKLSVIHELKLPKSETALTLYAKNLSEQQITIITKALVAQPTNFYNNLGLYK